jgi:hypothetical protein
MLILVSGGTKTIDNLRKHPQFGRLAQAHIGGLITPSCGNSVDWYLSRGMSWAMDNDCFLGLDEAAYRAMLARNAGIPGCQWVTCPDVVGDAQATLGRFVEWYPVLSDYNYPIAFVAQDGLTSEDTPWDFIDCLFIGGSTGFKLGYEARQLAKEAKERGKSVHMGRANSRKRLIYAKAIGCDSIDGRTFSSFGDYDLKWGIGFAASEGKQLSFESELTA